MSDYTITGYDEKLARLGVWFTGAPTPEWLWLPISEDGLVPVGDELHDWIMLHRPAPIIERGEIVAKGVKNQDVIIGMVPKPEPVPTPDPVEEAKRMGEWIEPGVLFLLKKYGLIKGE